MRFIDVHRFGNWRLFFDDEVADAEISYNPENTPPWIIHKEDLAAVNALYRRLVKERGVRPNTRGATSRRSFSDPPRTPTSSAAATRNRRKGTAPRA